MSDIRWTPSQRLAIDTVDRSVLVSAGAGSGKTAVLAERCAHIVADLRPPCSVDRLLVVTFTDAAASEMRERIAQTLRKRLEDAPVSAWLARQLALVDSAHISTLHSFCRRLLSRYFAQAELDPQMPLIDPADGRLLLRETAQQVFDAYEAREDADGEAFLNLLAAYSGGSERALIDRVLEVDAFLTSILDPEEWIKSAIESHEPSKSGELPPAWRARLVDALHDELKAQHRTVELYLSAMARQPKIVEGSVKCMAEYATQLDQWLAMLAGEPETNKIDALCQKEFAGYEFPDPPRKTKKLNEFSVAEQDAFVAAANLVRSVRDTLFRKGLRDKFGRFSVSDWADGVSRVRPHLDIFLRLVCEVRAAFQAAKTELGVMDFADLERQTVALLRNEANGVAARLRDQFEHVLVDEFQDTNPLQAEILRLVSREIEPGRHANLFTVGDVKQSIYRFRLAEPRLFLERMHSFESVAAQQSAPARGLAVDLAENFRSRPRLLEAVNSVVERLMAFDLGGIDYDEGARLKPGLNDESGAQSKPPPVELHILSEMRDGSGATDDDEEKDAAEDSTQNSSKETPEDWQRIEREAYVIAERIQECARQGYAYRDIVILLRSMKARSSVLLRTLARRGIPAYTDVSGGFFEALEVRDVLALLALLDNEQQDIPLASVLRSPLMGSPLTDSDLVEIRTCRATSATSMPFHAAVRAYADRGTDESLRLRLQAIRDRFDNWRKRMRRRPLADVLWEIFEQSGYLAYVSGMREGTQRRANLVRLHEYARQFGTFRRQGLARFLQFMDGLRESDQDLEPGVVRGGVEDVVRVMSIHRSKGLEFPVVIVAELGKRFNMSDARRAVLFDRRLGLGLEAVDVERRIAYPTLPHRLVAQAIVNESLAEEIRVLYVAMTRAKERLILVGTKSLVRVEDWRARYSGHVGTLPLTDRRSASGMLDWVVQSVCCLPESVAGFDEVAVQGTRIHVRTYEASEMSKWKLEQPLPSEEQNRLHRCAAFEPIQATPLSDGARTMIAAIERRLTMPYPAAPLTRVPAVAAASLLKRRWDAQQEALDPAANWQGQSPARAPVSSYRFDAPQLLAEAQIVDAAQRGTWTHEFLQRLDMRRPGDREDLRAQLDEMIASGVFDPEEAGQIDLDAIAWFLQTPLGGRIRDARCVLHREWPFVIGVDPSRYDPAAAPIDTQDRMLVRGIIDVMFNAGDGWEILDYKTDQVSGTALAERAELYRGQLRIYAAAVEATLQQPVCRLHLAFLSAREGVEV